MASPGGAPPAQPPRSPTCCRCRCSGAHPPLPRGALPAGPPPVAGAPCAALPGGSLRRSAHPREARRGGGSLALPSHRDGPGVLPAQPRPPAGERAQQAGGQRRSAGGSAVDAAGSAARLQLLLLIGSLPAAASASFAVCGSCCCGSGSAKEAAPRAPRSGPRRAGKGPRPAPPRPAPAAAGDSRAPSFPSETRGLAGSRGTQGGSEEKRAVEWPRRKRVPEGWEEAPATGQAMRREGRRKSPCPPSRSVD
uniref:uncharacterized protein LOC114607668 n=1 Tax=Podarcis muralis TaxID=64176 RepID=UPI00109F63E2|nr:uncharacterized protein LOC114607668 [Podarcis muralis]